MTIDVLALLALLLAAVDYIFVIYEGMYHELWIVRVVEDGCNIVYVVMTQVYSRAVMQQSTHNYIIVLSLCFLQLCLPLNH